MVIVLMTIYHSNVLPDSKRNFIETFDNVLQTEETINCKRGRRFSQYGKCVQAKEFLLLQAHPNQLETQSATINRENFRSM